METKGFFSSLPTNLQDKWNRVFTSSIKSNSEVIEQEDILSLLNLLKELIEYCGNDDELTMQVWYRVTWHLIFNNAIDDDLMEIVRLFSDLELPEAHAWDSYENIKNRILMLISAKREKMKK